MEVPQQLERPMKMWVQIGSRANLDGDIKWSTPVSVEVSGNGTITTKVNIRASGRYHRVRFFSNAVGAQWRIAGLRTDRAQRRNRLMTSLKDFRPPPAPKFGQDTRVAGRVEMEEIVKYGRHASENFRTAIKPRLIELAN
jgi:hypothetical protein